MYLRTLFDPESYDFERGTYDWHRCRKHRGKMIEEDVPCPCVFIRRRGIATNEMRSSSVLRTPAGVSTSNEDEWNEDEQEEWAEPVWNGEGDC